MSKQSEIISPYEPEKEELYLTFARYFENPIMTKVKDINDFSMYVSKISAQLGIEYRYIIAFVNKDTFSINKREKLSDLSWVSLQTRTLQDDYKLSLHSYIPQRLEQLDTKINLIFRDSNQYKYEVLNLPINVTLLPTKNLKQRESLQYNLNGSLITAIETYQTIITFIK